MADVCYGIAALLSVARTGVGDPNAGQTENLDAITAVVLGGTSLFGGRGIVLGSLVGARTKARSFSTTAPSTSRRRSRPAAPASKPSTRTWRWHPR